MARRVGAGYRPMRRSGRRWSEPAHRHPAAMLVHLWMRRRLRRQLRRRHDKPRALLLQEANQGECGWVEDRGKGSPPTHPRLPGPWGLGDRKAVRRRGAASSPHPRSCATLASFSTPRTPETFNHRCPAAAHGAIRRRPRLRRRRDEAAPPPIQLSGSWLGSGTSPSAAHRVPRRGHVHRR